MQKVCVVVLSDSRGIGIANFLEDGFAAAAGSNASAKSGQAETVFLERCVPGATLEYLFDE